MYRVKKETKSIKTKKNYVIQKGVMMIKETFYFTHDYNAHGDPKIECMLFELGWESYGLYWAIIEKLAQETTHKIQTNYDRIAFVLRSTPELIKCVIEKFDLFVLENGFFFSQRLINHFKSREEKSQKARDSIAKRWGSNTTVLRDEYDCNTIKERKGKERKEKNIREEGKQSFHPPSLEEIKSYCLANNLKTNPDEFFNYYETNGWRIGKNKMKRWDLTAKNWHSRGEKEASHKPKQSQFLTASEKQQKALQESKNLPDTKMRRFMRGEITEADLTTDAQVISVKTNGHLLEISK